MSNVSEVLGQKAIEWMAVLEALTKQYAPKAVDAALTVVQVNAIGHVIAFGVGFLISGTISFLCARTAWKAWKVDEHDWDDVVFLCFMIGLAPFVISCITLIELLDVWNWVAIFQPKLAVAHMIFEKIVK